ncbi:MAG: serine hydrolase domain-containing protein [Streptosporangiaceae bacterium]
MPARLSGAAELDAALASFVADNRLPGGAAAVVRGSELDWSAEIGFADVAAGRPAGRETLYRIASITKTFTGTAVMRLRDAGSLSLDDPAVTYLPELRSAASPFGPIEAVTIRRMLCHESGLATEPPGTDWSVSRYQGSPDITLANAADLAVKVPPESQHKYSDLAYQLLGEIVSRVSGVPYARYVRESILDPLGMSSTSFEPLAEPLRQRCATGYDWPDPTGEFRPVPEMSPVWAEGGLWSSAADLARWIAFQLDAHLDRSGDPLVLAPQSLREMHRPRYLADDGWTRARGITWCGERRQDQVWIQHAGGLPGFTSILCFDPARGVGAVVLVNGSCGDVDVAFELASIAGRFAPALLRAIEVPAAVPAEYVPLLGLYIRPQQGGWVFRVEWQGQLVFVSPEAPGWKLALLPTTDPDVFTVEPGSNFAGEDVVFSRHADGRVVSVLFVESSFVRLDTVAPAG